ncbi:hypothetical protein P1P75_19760 [Streptomyces sp. ID05-39B]|uniref:hypothetical protein n=1 Tax=Streptomyces sp. ID05-39B TaxID=3028664 RepID=UPI0029BD2F0E|nr:hypothetical protein [Streptomyces sp. ID05-39B]MDX3528619.1 hypothetical protein [Streptomyces sp. ID05-39B]
MGIEQPSAIQGGVVMDPSEVLRDMVSDADPDVLRILGDTTGGDHSSDATADVSANTGGHGHGHDWGGDLAASGAIVTLLTTGRSAQKFLSRAWRNRYGTPIAPPAPPGPARPAGDDGPEPAEQLSQDQLVAFAKRHVVRQAQVEESLLSLSGFLREPELSACLVSLRYAEGGVYHVAVRVKGGRAVIHKYQVLTED